MNATKPAATPRYATIPTWCAMSGIGRTTTYERIAAGDLRAVKVGNRTLIDVEHGLTWMRALPAAKIRKAA